MNCMSILVAVKECWNTAHFNFSKINRLFMLAKVGLALEINLVERQSSEDELLVVY